MRARSRMRLGWDARGEGLWSRSRRWRCGASNKPPGWNISTRQWTETTNDRGISVLNAVRAAQSKRAHSRCRKNQSPSRNAVILQQCLNLQPRRHIDGRAVRIDAAQQILLGARVRLQLLDKSPLGFGPIQRVRNRQERCYKHIVVPANCIRRTIGVQKVFDGIGHARMTDRVRKRSVGAVIYFTVGRNTGTGRTDSYLAATEPGVIGMQ